MIAHPAYADIGVVVADPTTIGASVYTHAGHSLVYLSGVCAATSVRARLCSANEPGSIVTAYPNFREDKPYAWNIVPFNLYVEGLVDPQNRLLYASGPVKQALEQAARSGFLSSVCGEGKCPQDPHSYWRDMIASTADRDVFIYSVSTTHAQDQAVVDWLNSNQNVNHYNGITNNCAVFTRSLVNSIFPHSVHRDFLNDIGIMSPKAAARSFSRWAQKRPDLGFYAMHFAQKPGALPRSGVARSGTETAIHMKKYLIPAALIGDHEVAGSFFVAYILTGRFNLYKEYGKYPTPSAVELKHQDEAAHRQGDTSLQRTLRKQMKDQTAAEIGSKEEWDSYRDQFAVMESLAREHGIDLGKKADIPKWFENGKITVDSNGEPWMAITEESSSKQVGISRSNILAPQSDPHLAYVLMLGRVGYMLRAKNHLCENIVQFRDDWSLLQKAHQADSVEEAKRAIPVESADSPLAQGR